MKNLAREVARKPQDRVADPEVQECVRQELEAAGCAYQENKIFLYDCGEVPTSIIGLECCWSFRRAWYYWVASGPGIPPALAEEFHKTWGKEVRVDGSCACPSPLEACKGFAVGSYHIDTQEGLTAFVALLKSIYNGDSK